MDKQRVVVVCPGRGSYIRDTSGYIKNHPKKNTTDLSFFEKRRAQDNQLGILKLDSMSFKSKIHMIGENASPLIYACSLIDFLSIDQSRYEIVAEEIVLNSFK